MLAMRFVVWCLVLLLFAFETCVSENSNGTSSNIEIPFISYNTSIASNGSNTDLNPIPPPTPIFNGTCDFSTCPETTNYSSRDHRPCKCDKDCVEFRDCCPDSEYYHEEDQQKPVDYECHQIGNFGYYLKRSCALSWDDVEISDKCASSVFHSLDTEAIELRSPVTSSRTNITYGNIYCAFCNNEFDDVVLWNVSVGNCDTAMIKPPNDLVINSPEIATTLAPVALKDYNINLLKEPIQLSFRDLTFNGKKWYYENETIRYDCDLILGSPSSLQFHYCSTATVPIIRDCPANWTDGKIAEQCRSIHSRVYNWHGTAYRNKYCAYCNGLNDFDITCNSIQHFSADVILSISDHFRRPKQQFTILFDFKLKIDSKICNETRKSYDKIQKKFCPHNMKSEESKHEKHNWFMSALSVYTFIAVLVSLAFLLLHLTIFFIVEELQTISGKNLASFCIALILAYGSFLLGSFVQDEVCYGTAVVMYYSFLSAFFWMLIISYDMWNTFWNATKKFRSPRNVKKRFIVYSIIVWSMPVVLVSTTLYFDLVSTKSVLAPHFGYSGCWFDNGLSLLVFFVSPVCMILIVNFALFLHTSYMLHSSRCESVNQKSRVDFKLFTRIGLLTGFTWITGFIAGYTQNLIIWFIFVVLNTAQGIFIFTAFSCKKRVIRSFLKRINKFEKWQRNLEETNVVSNGTTASTPLNDALPANTS